MSILLLGSVTILISDKEMSSTTSVRAENEDRNRAPMDGEIS